MSKTILCQGGSGLEMKKIKVKVIKAPLVDTYQLKRIIFSRARALVL